jgi:hypothetical protein
MAAFLMAMTVVLQSLSLLYVECEYTLNKAYVSNVLCVNRDKPQMHCDGKCFLKKELNRNADRQHNDQNSTTSLSLLLFFEHPLQDFIFPTASMISPGTLPALISAGYTDTAGRPPTA